MSAISGNRSYALGHASSHRDDAHSSISRNSPRRDHLTSTYSVENTAVQSATRQKQSKRDEAIRKKLETDLSKKKYNPARSRQTRKATPGSVSSLKLSVALQVKPNTTVAEAAQMMAAKREDCVLVTDSDNRISGIFTAKDLAFRVVGDGKRARDTIIADIMTINPLCARTDTNATEALELMVQKGFRHLPVMDENQDIFGVLDITKCFYEAMEKLERIYKSSSKLYTALEGVNSELGSSHPQAILEYVDALRHKLSSPTLESVLDGSVPTTVSVRTTVKEAATLMKENHTTALLIQDQGSIAGIFTSKDVVLRVIAPGLDPGTCSVVRVMTPHPDFAPAGMTIQAALRKMHDGHYLNLPVIGDDDGEIVGMVDVLKLTYATLEQVNTMQTAETEGPAWNKFWLSADHDTESVYSDNADSATGLSATHGGPDGRSQMSLEVLKNPDGEGSHSVQSASNLDEDHFSNERHSLQGEDRHAIQEEDTSFPFKFKAPHGRVHRIQHKSTSGISDLVQLVSSRLASSEIEAIGGAAEIMEGVLVNGFALSYVDAEGDLVSLTADQDVAEAIRLARRAGSEKVDLFVHDPEKPPLLQQPQDVGIQHHYQHLVSESNMSEEASHHIEGDDDDGKSGTTGLRQVPEKTATDEPEPNINLQNAQQQLIPGVPNDLILPGGAIFLAAVMTGVFILGRSSSR